MDHAKLTLVPTAQASAVRLAPLFEEYLNDTCRKNITAEAKRGDWNCFCSFLKLPQEQVTQHHITPAKLRDYREWLITVPFAPNTINRRLCSLRTFLSWAMGTPLELRFPTKVLHKVKAERLCPKALARKDLALLVAHIDLTLEALEGEVNEVSVAHGKTRTNKTA